jgi:hypothetical protein
MQDVYFATVVRYLSFLKGAVSPARPKKINDQGVCSKPLQENGEGAFVEFP